MMTIPEKAMLRALQQMDRHNVLHNAGCLCVTTAESVEGMLTNGAGLLSFPH